MCQNPNNCKSTQEPLENSKSPALYPQSPNYVHHALNGDSYISHT